ncbi:MAG: hypothetical protein M3Q08_00975 [Pseudomonadota bacterium]|nr:hypothetical protein [Pseudomonadota bacterium]
MPISDWDLFKRRVAGLARHLELVASSDIKHALPREFAGATTRDVHRALRELGFQYLGRRRSQWDSGKSVHFWKPRA